MFKKIRLLRRKRRYERNLKIILDYVAMIKALDQLELFYSCQHFCTGVFYHMVCCSCSCSTRTTVPKLCFLIEKKRTRKVDTGRYGSFVLIFS